VREETVIFFGIRAWKTEGKEREFWRQGIGRLRHGMGCNTIAAAAAALNQTLDTLD
jgi:hypothetical protein